jgi:uncharacterized protein YggE
MKNNFLLFLCLSLCSSLAIGQIKSLSVFGEADGVLAADYAVFSVTMDDQECSVRFPDLQAKQKRYVELTKEYQVPSADNELLEEKTTRMANYDGMKDVHMARYQLTLRNSDQFMQFMKILDEEIPGSDLTITRVEFGDKNAERELILTRAFSDAKHRAEVLAKQGNGKLGKLISISEERFNEDSNVLETLFTIDKKFKKDASAYSYSQLFPTFSVLIRVEFEFTPN